MGIYNKELTQTEVKELYRQQSNKLSNTITYNDTKLPLSTRDLKARVSLSGDTTKMTSLTATLFKIL